MAIVPELVENGTRKLLGVGRLIADPEHGSAEYAILIGDEWQNEGLGGLLTDYCLRIARDWGVKRVIATTTTDNYRMMAVFKKRGFELSTDHAGGSVDAVKGLA